MGLVEISLAQTRFFSSRNVGEFLDRYYGHLSRSPQHLHRFYRNNSQIAHPDQNGIVTVTTTLKAIQQKILSVDYGLNRLSMTSVDAQHSFGRGIIVVASGYFHLGEDPGRKFNQTFFLASQGDGYFVLNDILRFTDEKPRILESESVSGNSPEASNLVREGSSIYVGNLPRDVSPGVVDSVFSQFGVIRNDGIKIIRRRRYVFCFVEFEDADAVQRSIQASPLTISGSRAVVKVKRCRGRRV